MGQHRLLAIALIALITAGQNVMASNWSVEYSGGKFVISRDNNTISETVNYRTVSISALEGKHYTGVNGRVTLNPGESSKNIDVAEIAFSDVPLQYKYQGTNKLYYDFEVYDDLGNRRAIMRKTITSGGTSNNQYYLNNIVSYLNDENISELTFFNTGKIAAGSAHYHDTYFTPPTDNVETSGTLNGYVLIDDSYDYKYKSATIHPDYLYVTNRAGATGKWHKLVGNKLYASVVFTEKEKDDGYAYVQILIGDENTAYDTGYDPNGEVNTPVNSIYKACFELKKGSGAYDGNGKWIFPHSYDHHNADEQGTEVHYFDDHTAFWMNSSYLWQQKFRDESYRAGRFNNAFVLDPDISGLTVRFDCGGSNDDTYGYKDLFVRWALVDGTAPTVLKNGITVNSGFHGKGNYATISVPFSEPVTLLSTTRYILHTSWGALFADHDCNGSNVVSFRGAITADPGTTLTINSLEVTYEPSYGSGATVKPIQDLLGIAFGGDVSKSFDTTVEALYNINYNLNGGSIDGSNPSSYTNISDTFTLINPTRDRYCFAGWTGTGLDGPTMTVTIPSGSMGNRSYTATWAPDIAGYWSGDGTQANPYIISTPEGLDQLAYLVEDGNVFQNNYFELGADIDMTGINTFNGIGNSTNFFRGYFNGRGHSISNFTVTANGQNESGLFRYKQYGTVSNLVVNNATIDGARYVGAIIGYSKVSVSGCTATDCTITSSVNSGNSYTGAIVAYTTISSVSSCNVTNCTLTSGNSGGKSYIGSIIAYITDGDVTNCIIDGCTETWNCNTAYAGGVVGYQGTSYSARSLNNNVIANCILTGTASNQAHVGTVVGWINGDGSVTGSMGCRNNFIINTTTPGENSPYGLQYQSANTNGYHYRALTCGTDAPVSDVYAVNASTGIVVSGSAAASYAGTSYYSPDTEITVSVASGFTLAGDISYTPEGGSEAQATYNGKGAWKFTMAAADVTINSVPQRPLSLTQGTKDGVSARWSTFYDGATNYTLSGATAYTMGTDRKLYRLGTDGLTIPKGTAVVVIAISEDTVLTPAGTETLSITDHATGGNQLLGSDSAVQVSGLSGTPYVLSLSGEAIGFRQYTGSSIPAGKAYYLVTP